MVLSSENLSLSILYDNIVWAAGTESGWGFSCLVRTGRESILFDTGAKGSLLLQNMKAMDISPSSVSSVVLSHFHGDHTGGMDAFLGMNSNVPVYFPASFSSGFVERVLASGASAVPVSGPVEIADSVYSTGEMGREVKEQAMAIDTDKGLIIVTGCAHPGFMEVIAHVRCISEKNIFMIVGGFHLESRSGFEIEKVMGYFQRQDIRYVCPGHCTGPLAEEIFKLEFGSRYIPMGTGRVIQLSEFI
ncbi:MAG TPA: MBL fold metallo-hydrolase [Synergistales bacterium]|nr:MBL fold metallo-hydrolase [Synergistales bacterium]